MPARRRIEPFYLVLKDMDKGVFTVVGPMVDDTNWNHRVCEAQDSGRHVACYTAGPGQSRQQIVSNVEDQLKLRYTDEVFL